MATIPEMKKNTSISTTSISCPTCKKPVTEKIKGVFPFCTKRCKMIDFGKWTDEDYSIPLVEPEAEDIEKIAEILEEKAKGSNEKIGD